MIKKFFAISLALLCIDQITKYLILKLFPMDIKTEIVSGVLSIFPMYNENTIMAVIEDPFNMGGTYKFVYLFVFLMLMLGSAWVIRQIEAMPGQEKLKNNIVLGLALITGAGMGNCIDRFYRIGVVDFIHIHQTIIAFNFADVFAYLGIILVAGVCLFVFSNHKTYSNLRPHKG